MPRKVAERRGNLSDRRGGVSRGQSRDALGVPEAQTVGRRARGILDRSSAPAKQLERPFAPLRGDATVRAPASRPPVDHDGLMERVLERGKLLAARARVKCHGGSPGVDGMTVEELPGHLEALLTGAYRPSPVRRGEIPKPSGGGRKRSIRHPHRDL